MMQSVMNIVKVIFALFLALALIFSGFFLFSLLLGVAVIAGIVMWLRQKHILKDSAQWGRKDKPDESRHERITIIEGEVEELGEEEVDERKK